MTRERQKDTEIIYAKNLSKYMGYDWIINVPSNEDEWPDLLIKTSNDEFGLEVRDMYVDESRKGSVEKRDESFRNNLLKELAEKYYAKKDVPIRLEIEGPFHKEYIEKILEYLILTEFQEWETTEHVISIEDKNTTLFVERLSSTFGTYSRWECTDDEIGWVEIINEDRIEKIVKEKSMNIDKYKKNINKVSLLIVANRIYNSGKLLLEKSRKINTHGFDRVFFYMHPLELVIYDSD